MDESTTEFSASILSRTPSVTISIFPPTLIFVSFVMTASSCFTSGWSASSE